MATPQTIAEQFEEEQSDTVNVRGRIVRALVRMSVRDGDMITVERREVGAPRHQAIKLALADGVLGVNGQIHPAVALWSNTSPPRVELEVKCPDGATTLDLWNAWRLGEVDTSWIGNAGIVTSSRDGGQLLRCSDGVGEPSFSDLVVHVTVGPAP